MGRRGPAAQPTNLRVLRGNPGRRPINADEPKPPRGPVVKPDYLSEIASAEWDRVTPHLSAMGTVTVADVTALAVYCEAVARWRRLVAVVTTSPPVLNRDGILIKNPAYSQVRDAAIEVRMLAREFGLTPSARAGLRVDVHHHDAGVGRLFTSG